MSINWVEFHGRSTAIGEALEMPVRYFGSRSGGVVRRYASALRQTQLYLESERPDTIFVMQPPVPALLACVPYARRRGALLVGDIHTGALTNPKWAWARALIERVLRKHGFAIVTNSQLADMMRDRGVETLVLDDLITARTSSLDFDDVSLRQKADVPYILTPFAYANDEPVREWLEAARRTPEITVILTGRAPANLIETAPPNVRFTGFVSSADYQRLVGRAIGIAALTTRDMTMQRAGYEALEHGRPVLTSDFPVLRQYFSKGAVFARPDVDALADGIRQLCQLAGTLEVEMVELRELKLAEQVASISALESVLKERRS